MKKSLPLMPSLRRRAGKIVVTTLIALLLTALVCLSAGYFVGFYRNPTVINPTADTTTEAQPLYWYDPMFPGQKFDKPGKSPFMDMQLVPKYAGGADAGAEAGVAIPANITQSLAVKLAAVAQGKIEQKRIIPALTMINDREVAIVQSKSQAFVERVYPLATGEYLRAGMPIADLLLPEWSAAQLEFLALKNVSKIDPGFIAAARQKLTLMGMSTNLINQVWQQGTPIYQLTIRSPINGIVQTLMVREGMTLAMGSPLARINGINPLWLEADVPVNLAAGLSTGQKVLVSLQGENTPRQALIIAILPEVNEQTRTVKLRATLDNPDNRIRAGMLAEINLSPEVPPQMLVPASAVIRTGLRNVVIVAKDNVFQPVEVALGHEGNGKIEILSGLNLGEMVVESGQFLIDSEASFNGVLARLNQHGKAQMAAATPTDLYGNQPYRGRGVVESVEKDALQLHHEAIPALDWPARSITLPVQQPSLLQNLKSGDAIRFTLAQNPNGMGLWLTQINLETGQSGAAR